MLNSSLKLSGNAHSLLDICRLRGPDLPSHYSPQDDNRNRKSLAHHRYRPSGIGCSLQKYVHLSTGTACCCD